MAKKVPTEKATREALQEKLKKVIEGVSGAKNPTLNTELVNQALASLWMPGGISEDQNQERAIAAMVLLKSIKSENEIESMLATQMVGTHSAAMECLRRAMIPQQTFEGREQNLKHAAKLLSIYTGQMDALNKNRGKGQQKVTVEHVHVEAGAQAVVGNVQAASPAESRADAPPALTHAPGQVLDMKIGTRAPAKQRNK